MKRINVFGIIATAITAIGAFLPFASVMGLSVNYSAGDGVIVIIVCVVALILALCKLDLGLLICGIVNLAVIVYDGFINWEKATVALGNIVQRGLAIWVVLIGSILMIVSFFTRKKA